MSENSNMLLGVKDKPPAVNWILLAIQHVCAMFGATILVPIVVNTTVGSDVLSIPVALVTSGIGTLIYIACTRGRSPVYLGSSFAFIAPMVAGYAIAGKASVFTAIMCVGIVYAIISTIIRVVGKEWINKILPPVVVGPMIMIIGLSLAPTAIEEIGLNASSVPITSLIIAFVAFLSTAILAVRGKGILRVIPFLIGIIIGYIVAALLGVVDFSGVASAHIIEIPKFYIPFVDYNLNFGAILTIVPIALVTMVEHVGDHKVLSEIIGRDLIQDPGLDRTLLGDGIATFIAALLGGPANTTYGENTSVVGMTRVASVYVIGLAAIIAIIFAFSGHLTALLTAIPSPVLGGISILLYGFICVNGLKILIHNHVDFTDTKNVVVAATMLVLGLGGATLSIAYGNLSLAISGMSLAAIIGIILNLCIPEENMNEIVLNHPLITHKLGILRDIHTGTKEFRELITEISTLLCYEATKDAKLEKTIIETPLEKMETGKLNEDNYAIVPILRAGMGMLDGIINVIPNAKVGHIGLYRDEETFQPIEYYFKMPENVSQREVLIIDPMLATGGSASATISRLKEEGVKKIKLLCVVAAPEGINLIEKDHPDVQIYCATVDRTLNESAYILPGLGDAGDRVYGTK